jgi:DNA-3-methyladenine glycosylase II
LVGKAETIALFFVRYTLILGYPRIIRHLLYSDKEANTMADELVEPSRALREAVTWVCAQDPAFNQIEAVAGALQVRSWSPGFAALLRIIVGQQLSAKAAQAIFTRLGQRIALTPEALLACPEPDLKQVGLSQAKIATCQRLAELIVAKTIDLEGLGQLPDETATAMLTQVKGIGVWSADIYLLFCLERLNSFPASDLAIQVAYQKLKQLADRPTRSALLTMTQPLAPYRGAAAHLLWHYYRFAMGKGS